MAKWMVIVCALAMFNNSGCRKGTAAPDASLSDGPLADGTLSFSWRLTDGTNDITCADVAGLSVRVLVTPSVGGFADIDIFSCDAGQVTTRAFTANTYNVVVELSAAAGLLAAPMTMNNVDVIPGGNTDLGEFVFEVPRQGNAQFTIDADALGLNCDPAPGGGGINNVLFELRDSANQCVGTFDIGAGATQPAGTYVSDCSTPFTCIENDQTISVNGLTSGRYRLTITADKGGLPCYSTTPQFDVPGNNLTTDLMTQFLIANPAIIGCVPDTADAGVPDAGTDAAVTDAAVTDAAAP